MLKHMSLFSGIESFKRGLDNLRIENELVGYSEIDKYASKVLAEIHGVEENLNYGNIRNIDERKVPDCDLITYGFPCQDLSVGGLRKGIVKDETRSGLLFDALRIIKEKKPKYAIAENVKNLIGKGFIKDFQALLAELDSYGYNNYWNVMNSKDYGIPQQRERIFIVSIRKDVDTGLFTFPEMFTSDFRIKDFLETDVAEKYFIDDERTERIIREYKPQLSLDTNRTERIGGLFDTETRKRQAGAIWDIDYIAPTITTSQGGYREPLWLVDGRIRKATPKECFLLMGFNDEDYDKGKTILEKEFYNGKDRTNSQMLKMAGNSIVVNVIQEILIELLL